MLLQQLTSFPPSSEVIHSEVPSRAKHTSHSQLAGGLRF